MPILMLICCEKKTLVSEQGHWAAACVPAAVSLFEELSDVLEPLQAHLVYYIFIHFSGLIVTWAYI